MRPSRLVLALLIASAAPPFAAGAAGPARVVIVTEARSASPAVVAAIRDAAGAKAEVTVLGLPEDDPIDPIAKGRLLAGLQRADLVVPIADRATDFVLREREAVPVYFIGAASLVEGRALAAPDVSGVLPYNIEDSLALIQTLGLSPLGLAYTPGYSSVAAAIDKAAGARGIATVRRSIVTRGAVGPAVRDLTASARVVWVLGDPLLTRGAGFDFLIEQSLAARVPVVAPARWEVARGALVGSEIPSAALAEAAGAGVRTLLVGAPAPGDARLTPAPSGGTFLVNRTLIQRWSITMPPGTPWKGIH